MKEAGITALDHPATIDVATTHGVFLLQDPQAIAEQYKQSKTKQSLELKWLVCLFVCLFVCTDPDQPSMMGKAKKFLHKAPKKTLESSGAKIPGLDQVCGSSAFFCC